MISPSLDIDALALPRRSVRRLMGEVMLALVPGTLAYAWLIGPGVLTNVAVAASVAIALEAAALRLRRRDPRPALGDGSIVLAAWLLALAVPPTLPPAQLAIGVAAAVLLGKHLYGGLGHNPFNPAMVGYAVLIVSFPVTMTAWPDAAAGSVDALRTGGTAIGSGATDDEPAWDALTGATPLDGLRTLSREGAGDGTRGGGGDRASGDTREMTRDGGAATDDGRGEVSLDAEGKGEVILGSAWAWINAAFLAGGLWMLARGVIGWRIPTAMLGTLALLHWLHGALSVEPQPPVHAELLGGAAMLGAFFIATDPVSAASGPRARLLYGAGIGALTFVLREYSAYPEGVAFAVLLMNATVPVLDRLSGPREAGPGEAR